MLEAVVVLVVVVLFKVNEDDDFRRPRPHFFQRDGNKQEDTCFDSFAY
jgi:hypothetical protein